jgi:hypothetical protein
LSGQAYPTQESLGPWLSEQPYQFSRQSVQNCTGFHSAEEENPAPRSGCLDDFYVLKCGITGKNRSEQISLVNESLMTFPVFARPLPSEPHARPTDGQAYQQPTDHGDPSHKPLLRCSGDI